ncbi:BamA/TamA family outer membrane protein [Maribellus comscasis]|uniref:BamA/TamA family outer membrane protein n=1 Tax=Maribellus comscasis TaxID=2681766 RepID=A0A6I6JJ44_9BACT|nr:BamA/TamA family outer membrane protein [Maribellus comscasis]QGY42291.1 BamA/TamA family outer membrane protein [Maribellus comscasis]
MLRRLFFLIFVFLGCIIQMQGQENYEIRKISFKGDKSLEESFLLERMALEEVSGFQKLITSDEPALYNKELIDLDLERLKKIYQREGFIDVAVSAEPPDINDKKQIVKLKFIIEEGEPVQVDSVYLVMVENKQQINVDSLKEKAIKKLQLKEGKRFRDEALQEDLAYVENIFRDLGHAYVSVIYELGLKPGEKTTSIRYKITPGPVCNFGETTVTGNKHVSETFIRKQFEYEEGELYNKSLLTETRQSLYHLQLFRVVSVLPQKDPQTRQSPIPVKLYVEEAPRVDTKFGVGYGTEDKFRTFVDFSYLGFLGTARRINLYAKHSALEPYYISLKWTQPQILNKNGSISLNPFISSNSEPGYNTRTYGVNVPLTYSFNSRLNSTLTYYLENVEQEIEAGDPDFEDTESEKFPYNKSGMLLSTVFSTARPKFSPERGVSMSFGFKFNGYVFGGDFSYTRLWGDIRTYRKIGDWILALRVMAGGINSSNENGFIPVEDRFYSGGSNSIRGWNRSELGPRRESGSPLGGKSIIETNIELRYPLFWRISGVAFFEGGNVWTGSYRYKLNDLGYAAGGGIRVETPIGPVRFDVGLPVWNQKRSPQFFISVGQAF